MVALRQGTLRAPSPLTVEQAADQWVDRARAGTIQNGSGDLYKPSVIRTYEIALRLRVPPEIGGYRLSDLRRTDLQEFVDRMVGEKRTASTIRNKVMPLRAIYRHAHAAAVGHLRLRG